MKQTVQMDNIQAKMRPGVISLSGFLGADGRKLAEILDSDDSEVKRLDLEHGEIARRMIDLRDAGMAGLGDFISVPPHFEVRVESVRGKMPCPFGDPGVFPKTVVIVKNLALKRDITYTDMSIHLILAHGFYQGKGSLFRLEPGDLAEVLEISADRNSI